MFNNLRSFSCQEKLVSCTAFENSWCSANSVLLCHLYVLRTLTSLSPEIPLSLPLKPDPCPPWLGSINHYSGNRNVLIRNFCLSFQTPTYPQHPASDQIIGPSFAEVTSGRERASQRVLKRLVSARHCVLERRGGNRRQAGGLRQPQQTPKVLKV